jgi:hypothetical protein
MPGGDRKGPMAMGAMTGRAAGYCGGFGMPGYANPAAGRGFGIGFERGRGFGGARRGRRNMFYATGRPGWMRFGGYGAPYGYPVPYQKPDPEVEKQTLKSQAEALQAQLDFINKRLAEAETDSAAH